MDIIEIPFLLENKTNRKITFSVEGITIEKMSGFVPAVFIPADDIAAIRYGVDATYGYKFAFGRQYYIQLKDYQNKVHSIKLTSVYGIRKKTYHQLWVDIFNNLWDHYFGNVLNYYFELLNIGQSFEVAGVRFTGEGIEWGKKDKIAWREIAISNYQTYFMIYNITNYRQNKSCSFANDWNAIVLQSILKSVVSYYAEKADR